MKQVVEVPVGEQVDPGVGLDQVDIVQVNLLRLIADIVQAENTLLALAVLAALAVFAGPVSAYLGDTSAQLFDREGYVEAVLSPAPEG